MADARATRGVWRSRERAWLLIWTPAVLANCGGRTDLPPPAPIAPRIAGANADMCLLDSGGRIRCWGVSFGPSPVKVLADGARAVAVFPNAQAAAVEGTSACYVVASGAVRCVDVAGAESDPEIDAAEHLCAGPLHACAVSGGQVLCWGANGLGQLGDGTRTDRADAAPVVGLDDAVEVACGETATCARRAEGDVVCWGADFSGALGDGAAQNADCEGTPCSTVPVDVELPAPASQIAAGLNAACVRSGGEAYCWGWNGVGEVGDGTVQDRDAPVKVVQLSDAATLYAGYLRKCAAHEDGRVSCWGFPVGITNESTEASLVPVGVDGLEGVIQIAGGWYHLCALDGAGDVWCWGDNEWGQLGDGTLVSRETPGKVPLD